MQLVGHPFAQVKEVVFREYPLGHEVHWPFELQVKQLLLEEQAVHDP